MKKSKRKYLSDRPTPELFGTSCTESIFGEDIAVSIVMQMFSQLLDDILFYREKYMADKEDEDLHQLRVALRRSVVLAGECRLLFKGERLEKHRRALKKIITLSNVKRDMDVMIVKLQVEKNGDEIVQYREAMDILESLLGEKLKREEEKTLLYLQSKVCNKVMMQWRNYITETYKEDISIYGNCPVVPVSQYLIWQRFLKIKKEIRKLNSEQQIGEILHRLRISFKKLRYLLESFAYLYEKKVIGKLLKKSKKLQNILGDFHDAHQQTILFKELFESLKDENVRSFISEVLLSEIKAYQKKSLVSIRKRLKRFLKKEKMYRKNFT